MSMSKFLCGLFLVSLVIRAAVFIGYLQHEDRYWQVDSATYHHVATQLVHGNGFVNADGSSHFYRLPGYSLFLAACYATYGETKPFAIWMQLILASFIPIFVVMLALMLFQGATRVAYLSGLYASVHVGLVLYSGFFMTESLFILFFILFLLIFYKVQHIFATYNCEVLVKQQSRSLSMPASPIFDEDLGPEYQALTERQSSNTQLTSAYELCQYGHVLLVGAGLLLGVASLIRPVGHYLLVVALFVLSCAAISWKEWFARSFILTISWFFIVAWWLLRNYLLTGVLFFHTLPGGHFLYLSAARVAMQVHEVSYQEARNILELQVRSMIEQREQTLGTIIPEIEACQIHEQLALKYFLMRPLVTLRCWVTDMFRAACSLYSAELLFLESGRKHAAYFDKDHGLLKMFKRYLYPETNTWWLPFVLYAEILFFGLILIGFCGFCITSLWNSAWWGIMMTTVPFIFMFIVIALSGGYARMRLPVEPLIMILSCMWWLTFFKIKRALT